MIITVKTLFGFEDILEKELHQLGYSNIKKLNRAVQLEGSWKDVYRLNYLCRLAISVLVEVKSFRIKHADELYEQAKKIDWTSYFERDKTFAVKGAVFSTLFSHSQYPYLVVKDAIADVFRDKTGDRPNVNIKAPQVLFDIYIKEKEVTISLNTSGVPLFQRGYRQETGDAPMNEVLAAGLLQLSGWDAQSTFIDPMCGSGTLAIEAALLAAEIPSMVERTHFAFKNFTSFIESDWEEVLNSVNRKPKKLDFSIIASDSDAAVLQKAKRNSKSAPIGNMIQFELADFRHITPPSTAGTLICNPPYGERMGEEVDELYSQLGDFFKNKMTGYSCWIISSNLEAMKFVGLKPSKKEKVFNGSLECTFRRFDIFEGTKKIKHTSTPNEEYTESNTRETPTEVIQEKTKRVRKETVATPKSAEREPKKEKTEVVSKYKSYTPKYLAKEEEQTEKENTQVENTQEDKTSDVKKEQITIQNNKEKIEKLRKYRHREDD